MAKKKSKKGAKATKKGGKDGKDKKPSRPTRCGPDFHWQDRPRIVEAAAVDDARKVRKLLVKGADPNEALHFAVGRGKLSVVKALIEGGADLHTEIKEGDYWVPPPRPATPPVSWPPLTYLNSL